MALVGQSATLAYRPLSDDAATTTMWLVHRRDDLALPSRRFLDIVRDAPD